MPLPKFSLTRGWWQKPSIPNCPLYRRKTTISAKKIVSPRRRVPSLSDSLSITPLSKGDRLYRFDWKISLADYLGLNDFLRGETYPGRSYLTVNPMEGDIAAIRQLNRQQRDALVSTLATFYAQQAGLPTTTPQRPQPQTTLPEPTSRPPTVLPPVPQPGSAGLLAPPEPPRPMPTGESRFLLP